jgi:hypothetical protein
LNNTFDDCPNENPNFNPTNITFVFTDNLFDIFRRINERKFVAVNESDQNIPWKANRVNPSNVSELFKINARINGSVLSFPEGRIEYKKVPLIYSNSTVYEYEVNDRELICAKS